MDRFAEPYICLKPLGRAGIRTGGSWCVWLVGFALAFGLIAFWSEQSWLLVYFFPLAYVALILAAFWSIRAWNDFLNPLTAVVVIATIRFFASGLLLASGAEPPENAGMLFILLKLTDSDWHWAHALALLGTIAAVTGWLMVQPRSASLRGVNFHLVDGVKWVSVGAMLVGFMALFAFFVMNASSGAVFDGSFRGATINEGTGKFFFLSYLLITGSVLLCNYFLSEGSQRMAWIPIAVCMLAYWPLGGRGRAMFPVACGLILMWYQRREREGWRDLSVKPVYLLKAAVSLAGLILVSYGGAIYRGESDGQAFSVASFFAGVGDYLAEAIYTDFGALHSLAGAVAIGPAVLGGENLLAVLLWPVSELIGISGRHAGAFIVETLRGFENGRKWALSPTIIGDAYLSLGLWGVVIVMILYGALLKTLYLKFRQGVVHSAIYTLFLLNTLMMLVSSINVWGQNLTLISFTVTLMFCGNTVVNLRGAKAYRAVVSKGASI